MSRSLEIPVKLLHEASDQIVTVELKSGEVYRGSMIECEDNWSCQLENVTYTAKVMLSGLISAHFNRWESLTPRGCLHSREQSQVHHYTRYVEER